MTHHSRKFAVLAAVAAGMLPSTAAQAQYYNGTYAQPAPLYPYAVPQQQPYAIEVAPNTYVIRRPAAPRFDRPHKPANRALIEELRKRSPVKRTVINTKRIVREPPVVVETRRVVDDPPRVIERRHVVVDEPVRARRKPAEIVERDGTKPANRGDTKKRVIEADAEITILGPDRMSIRLFRKGHKANARLE